MSFINAAKDAIRNEIKKLESILKDLEGSTFLNPATEKQVSDKGRGRPKGSKNSRTPVTDAKAVLAIIKNAGKINAVSLGHQLRKRGLAKIPTAQLIEAGVKVSGTKGSTTYSYAG